MEKEFKNHIRQEFPYLSNARLLLGVSGGVDSVVLACLCRSAKLNFSIAHCNFNLRGYESDGDADFVVALAGSLDVEVFVQNFDTSQYAEEAKISIQMAARDLRYDWFKKLSTTLQYDYILTAHHANDNLETFLINLVRGSGLEGFTGIKSENKNLIRPLLKFSRQEIENYAKVKNLSWREDTSNASSKYLRNKIRHQVVPVLEEMNPKFLETFAQTQEHLKESCNLVEDYVGLLYSEIVNRTTYGYELRIDVLEKIPNTKAVLYHLLKTFGFTEWNDVYDLLKAQSGKFIYSDTHRLIKDRDLLLLTEKPSLQKDRVFEIPEGEEIVMLPAGTFTFQKVQEYKVSPPNCIYVDEEKLSFPLTLRKWREGDSFYPFGMKGKKKISDFFKDKKLSLPEKEDSWLLCSGNKIVWVVNQRADGRFAVTDSSRKILKITYSL